MILSRNLSEAFNAQVNSQIRNKIRNYNRSNHKLSYPRSFGKLLRFVAYITDNGMDFPAVAGIYRGQLTDQTLCRHAGAGEYIASVPVRYFDPEPKRNLCNFSRLQGAVIGHIHIRPGVVAVWTERATALRRAKVN